MAGARGLSGQPAAAVAGSAARQFERLMAHSRLPAMLLAAGAAAQLPPAAEVAVAPLPSLLPLADGLSQPQVSNVTLHVAWVTK